MPQLKRILVPTDFSENASQAYKFAQNTAEHYGAKVDYIHIIPLLHYFNVNYNSLDVTFESKDMYPKLREEAKAKIEKIMEDSLKPENTGKAIVNVENRPSSGIRKYAKENNYDLILMGNRGRHQSEFLRGSVAEKLIRASKVPVLTLNKADNSDFRHIVMPTDASLTSMAALPMALLVAAQRKASLTLLSVEDYEAKNINREGGGEKTVDTYLKNGIIKNLKKFIKTQTPNISFEINPEDGDSVIQIKSDEGKLVKVQLEAIKKNSAHQGIVDYASKNADLVVMGTHGRSGLMKVFLGSTAEKVLRRLDLPILTVRPKNIKKNKKDKKQ